MLAMFGTEQDGEVRGRCTITVRLIVFDFVVVLLSSLHDVEQRLSVNATFGVAICSHVASIAPLQLVDELKFHEFTEPAHMS